MDVEGVVDEGEGGGVTVDPVDGATVGVSYRVVAPISLSAFSPHAIPGGGGSACCSSGTVLARSSASWPSCTIFMNALDGSPVAGNFRPEQVDSARPT